MIHDTIHNRAAPVHLTEPCNCGGQWEIVSITVEERIRLRIGGYWVAHCPNCRIYSVAYTLKQEEKFHQQSLDKP